MIKIILKYTVNDDDAGKRVSTILRDKLNVSARLLIKLKNNNCILVNKKAVYTSYEVQTGDCVEALIDFKETDEILMQKMDLDILYEDEYILAVNKPAGMVVHPSSYHPDNTLANGVKYYLNNDKKIRPINRLDRDTSGIVLFAKNEYVQEAFLSVKPYKEYIAIINGNITPEAETIDAPIARKEGSIMERIVSERGQRAITHYETVAKFDDYSMLKINIETGRTHQIRVHLSYKGNPILGDTLYGNESEMISRQALHAYRLFFIHPITKKQTEIIAPLPDDMKKLIHTLH